MRSIPLHSLNAAFLVFTLSLILGGSAWLVSHDRMQSVAAEELRLRGYARAFAEHAQATTQRIDSLLLTLRERWKGDRSAFAAEVERQRAGLGALTILIGVVDAKGRVVFDSLTGGATNVNSSDRHHFVSHANSKQDRLVISPPAFGRITGRWFVQMSRRLGGEGGFEGVVFIATDPRYYARFYESLGLGPESAVAMIRDTGEMLTRHPYSDSYMGTKVASAPFLDRDAPQVGGYRRASRVDGVERFYGFVRLPQYGVTLVVGDAADSVLAPSAERAKYTFAVAVTLCMVVVLMFVLIRRRIAAQEHAEETVRQLNARLEDRVAERTAQLVSAIKELEAFAYSVSHDLKAPLRGIDGYSRLLEEEFGEQLGTEGRGYVENVRRGTKQMNELITDLLAYARLERAAIVAGPIELQPLVEGLLGERESDIAANHVRVVNVVPALTAVADRGALDVALRNLLDNALKFTRGVSDPAIEVGARDNGAFILLWVKDNGPGFDMAYHDRIFEMFQRLHRAEDFPGTGIGLAIVKKAMERMGGSVRAESSPGMGATLYLEIPA